MHLYVHINGKLFVFLQLKLMLWCWNNEIWSYDANSAIGRLPDWSLLMLNLKSFTIIIQQQLYNLKNIGLL